MDKMRGLRLSLAYYPLILAGCVPYYRLSIKDILTPENNTWT